ncbi:MULTISPECIES: hypothetical protein [unclassified Campylobacter]|uniref:hypothetical protein n=1 Tax=unclassified Campylobacter TaxID=2593542 RepID=UPI0022E9E175|nr:MULTISPECIES: hypothetical protein [unclassified Campylobacter]MBQ7271066.1 hypothetical protein [Campylobacter sp.]MDA3080635.1 ribbon-helix-helix domain-containing protein [Campylobacter sp. CS_NA1]MDA3085160.1 ribbon-helix-helix domain-containing protein [Campylobacter sp. CS_ED1]MDA3089937.1 ribbon-helix-helix domain-containing protein [Campylobacter sp. CS_ED2]
MTTNNTISKMSITIDSYLKNEIDNISEQLGKTKSGIIAEALEYYFDKMDLILAEKRAKDSKKNFISLDEMEKMINEMAN